MTIVMVHYAKLKENAPHVYKLIEDYLEGEWAR